MPTFDHFLNPDPEKKKPLCFLLTANPHAFFNVPYDWPTTVAAVTHTVYGVVKSSRANLTELALQHANMPPKHF